MTTKREALTMLDEGFALIEKHGYWNTRRKARKLRAKIRKDIAQLDAQAPPANPGHTPT